MINYDSTKREFAICRILQNVTFPRKSFEGELLKIDSIAFFEAIRSLLVRVGPRPMYI